jgi:hypothetical protein
MIIKELLSLAETRKPADNSPLAQLQHLPQPIGINGGSYTYWVDVTKTPLKFTASDGSEIEEAKTLKDIAKWLDKWAASFWLEFLDGQESLEVLQDERIIRVKTGHPSQANHEEFILAGENEDPVMEVFGMLDMEHVSDDDRESMTADIKRKANAGWAPA